MTDLFFKGLKKSYENINKNKELLNKINVFPAPDKDTGNNIEKTLKNIWESDSLKELSSKIMANSRGSSGNILAVYVLGLYKNESDNLTDMCSKAAQYTWNMITDPQEGTILSAMKSVPEFNGDLRKFIHDYILNGINILLDTEFSPESVRKYRTLDSGILGWILILDGLYEYISGKSIVPHFEVQDINVTEHNYSRYCIELEIKGYSDSLKKELNLLGNEIIIIDMNDKVKIHIHSNDYNQILDACERYGEVIYYKIEDMQNDNRRIYL